MSSIAASHSGERSSPLTPLLATGPHRHTIGPRVMVALPLIGIGMQHLVGTAPLRPILEEAGIPLPGVQAVVAPLMQVLAGVLVAAGLFTRAGAVLTLATMLGAIYAHLAIDVWPITDDSGASMEPPIALPIVIALASAYLLFRGGGRWSLDRRLTTRNG